MIDLAIVYVALIVLLITVAFAGPGTNSAVQSTVLIVGLVACTLGYPVAFETLWHGRTLGKAAMGLRVVRDDGGPIRFRQAFVRGLAAVFLEKLGLTLGLLALILIVAGASKKRLGDHLAGTIVLQERVPGRLEAPVAMPAPLAGWAASLDLSAVDDALALRMRQFLDRAGEFTPDARAGLEHQLATEVVAKVGAPPPHTPGWAIISAVLAERRRRAFATQAAALPPPPMSHTRRSRSRTRRRTSRRRWLRPTLRRQRRTASRRPPKSRALATRGLSAPRFSGPSPVWRRNAQ